MLSPPYQLVIEFCREITYYSGRQRHGFWSYNHQAFRGKK